MIKLNIKTFKLPARISPEICTSFKRPLIFYLTHKNDERFFFLTFVILDFTENKLKYIVSYLPENVKKIEAHPRSEIFRIPNSYANPHCTLLEKKSGSFLTFIELVPYFFKVDHKNDLLYVYTDDSLESDPKETVIDFSPTNYPDKKNPDYFYFSSLRTNKTTQKRKLVFHKASLDLSYIKNIYTKDTLTLASPHTIKKIGHYLVNSDFLICKFKNLKSGEIFENRHQYAFFVYKSLYRKYCEKKGLDYSEEPFLGKKFLSELKMSQEFFSFCQSRGKNFLEICKRNPEYAFSPLPGSIMILDLDTKEEKDFPTTFCAPAHFEVDKKSGEVFVSSHNFITIDRRYYWGPAAIDRFRLEKGELNKVATFTNPSGYRFTSHKVFTWKEKTYVCTLGQPNRLFFIDAETMELEFFEDIGEDFLSTQSDLKSFLNYADFEPFVIKTIEVSADGNFIFLLSYDYIYFYSFPERRIVQKIRYNEGTSPDGKIDLTEFIKKTTHADYL